MVQETGIGHRGSKSSPRRQGVAALLATMIGSSVAASKGDDRPGPPGEVPVPVVEPLPGLHLLEGPWRGGTVYRESVLFVRGPGGKPSARLLRDAERVLSVHDANGRRRYEAGKDYESTPDGSGLVLAPSSRIASLDESALFPPKGSEHSIGHRAGHPETSLLFGEGHFFHDQQVEVTYVPRSGRWAGYRPEFAGGRLPGTLAKLRAGKPLTLAVSGDSISQGYNASGYTKAPPFMPPYPDLVAAQLEKTYGSKVTLHNLAIAGWSAGQGLRDVEDLLARKPGLAIVAYGMNDVGARDPGRFKETIAALLRRIKEADPATEVILVASMIGNPEWVATPPEMFPKYRDALAELTGPGVVLADMTALWRVLLDRKRFADATGNGVNHPDDYGHRLYAQAILALLVDSPERPTP